MFEKFGEFDSFEEINRAAAAQLAEGDTEALIALAVENGIDKEEAEDYIDGVVDELCNLTMAAFGKIDIESAEYELKGTLHDYAEELKAFCINDEKLAAGIRKKGKSLAEYMAIILDKSYENRVKVSKKITDKTKSIKKLLGSHTMEEGALTKLDRLELANNYYREA